MKQQFRVGGMSCAACSSHVEKSVSALPGVRLAQVNLLAGSMTVDYDESLCDQAIPRQTPPMRTTACGK